MADQTTNPEELTQLLDYLKESRGFDFTGYKRTSLERRLRRRMQDIGIDTFSAFRDRLEVDPAEFTQLFDYVLINVTAFFRDPEVWDFVSSAVIPRLLENKKADAPIRVWTAGCASGEEAYSVAMLLAEHLGREDFIRRVKIYATDVDQQALTTARLGIYGGKAVTPIPPDLLNRYFDRTEDRFVFNKDLRRAMIFGRHDLVQDAPISRVDLLTCRNTLMYFNGETQARMVGHFYYALNPDGYLVLGKAEMMTSHSKAFTPVELRRRIFVKAEGDDLRERVMLLARTGDEVAAGQLTNHIRGREVAFEGGPVPQIVVDRRGMLILANVRARETFQISRSQLGRPFHELEMSFRPVELRSHIQTVQTSHKPVQVSDVTWTTLNGQMVVDVLVDPLLDASGGPLGVSVSFLDVTRSKTLQEALEHTNQELETAMEELQSTNEELETTNEELQSTNEELETTNEELQSTNEELETMNEELQSTNEELETMNEELRDRTGQLDSANAFLATILGNVKAGVIVVDTRMRVRVWNTRCADMWGLREDEVHDQHLFGLDIGLPLDKLREPVQRCVSGETSSSEVTTEAINRRGRTVQCRVTITPMKDADGEVQGAILLVDEDVDPS